jgi:hypothetical protein
LRTPVPLHDSHAIVFLLSVYPIPLHAGHVTVPSMLHAGQRPSPSHVRQTHDWQATLRFGTPLQPLHTPDPLQVAQVGTQWQTGQVPLVHTAQME